MVGVVVVVAVCVVVVLSFHVSIFNVPLFSILWSFSNRQLHKMPVKNGSRSCNSCIKRHIGMYAQQSTIQFAHCTHSSPTTHTRYVFGKFPRQEYRILSIIHNVWNSVYRNVIKKRANKNNENIIDGSTKDNNEEKRSSSNSNSGRRKKKQQQQLKTTKSTMLKWWWWRRQKALSLLVHISHPCQPASQPDLWCRLDGRSSMLHVQRWFLHDFVYFHCKCSYLIGPNGNNQNMCTNETKWNDSLP